MGKIKQEKLKINQRYYIWILMYYVLLILIYFIFDEGINFKYFMAGSISIWIWLFFALLIENKLKNAK